MSDHHNPPAMAGESPFDAIRRVTPEGREYWSARELMPLLGYDEWRKFDGAVDRARVSASNAGYTPTDHFVGADKKVQTGSGAQRHIVDRHLSRYACYLVALNGDPRKPEIAAAQTYFVIKTREAEAAREAVQLPSTRRLAQMVIDAEDAREAAEAERDRSNARLVAEQKHRQAIEAGDGIHLTDFGKKYFSETPARTFDAHLYSKGWLINQLNTRVRPDGSVRDGYDHRKPTAKGRPFIYDHDQGNYGGRRRFQPRVRPQKEIELRDALATEGLPVNTHSTGLVLITNDEMKELGA